ncbi:MAG: pyridoxamine kinase [Clostridia bacterium]|nr:pyridoxamine kinase [Clostridia bacterium]
MKNPVLKIAAVHDLSGFGRCSFSVILPTLSAMGHQVCPLPTASLSTHTGGYTGFVFRDLTPDMEGWWKHWQKEKVEFDAFYSGFLGNAEQIDITLEMIDSLPDEALIFVDPVMGDDGVLYSTYTEEMREGMKRLVKRADVITPNITEAAFLLDRTPKSAYTDDELYEITLALTELCSGEVVITGVEAPDGVGALWMGEDKKLCRYIHKKHEKSYPGTGDIFASVLLGRLLKGDSLDASVKRACDFIYNVVGYSKQFDYPTREGVLLEARLSELID